MKQETEEKREQMLQEKLAAQLCLNNNAFALIIRDEKDRELAIPREQVSKTKLAVIF